MDLDDFTFDGLNVKQPELRRTAGVSCTRENVGQPTSLAADRLEQSWRVTGFLDFAGRRRRVGTAGMGNRDHSCGAAE